MAAVRAETRVALVIGNAAYKNVAPLMSPTNDARLVADALKQDGFSVTLADDLGRDGFHQALTVFGHAADNADWAVIYYAGHGVEIAGMDYVVPVDAKLDHDSDVAGQAIPLDRLMAAVKGIRKFCLIAFDASRKNPIRADRASNPRTAARPKHGRSALKNFVIVYSTEAGSEAIDGGSATVPSPPRSPST